MINKFMNEGLTQSEAEAKAAKESADIDSFPVESVSWNNCQQFCAKTKLRLPTEAEWEYACRTGVRKPTYGDLNEIAWFDKNSSGTTHIVGKKLPNALGFNDMLGNVCEWCSDIFDMGYYKSCEDGVVDPKGAAEGSDRVLRGDGLGNVLRDGIWNLISYSGRSSDRGRTVPDNRNDDLGFRAARTP